MAKIIHSPLVSESTRKSLPSEVLGEHRSVPVDALSPTSFAVAAADSERENSVSVEQFEQVQVERDEALAHLAQLQKELAAIKEQLREREDAETQQGYQCGFERGMEEARAELAGEFETLTKLMENLATEQLRLAEGGEELAVEIAYAAIVKILGQSASDFNLCVAAVKQAISDIQEKDGLILRLSLADYRRFQQEQPSWLEQGVSQYIELRADESVALGGCIVETRGGSLDARLEVQMEKLKVLLLKTNRDSTVESQP